MSIIHSRKDRKRPVFPRALGIITSTILTLIAICQYVDAKEAFARHGADTNNNSVYIPVVKSPLPLPIHQGIRTGRATLLVSDFKDSWVPGDGPFYSFDVWKGEVVEGLSGDFWYQVIELDGDHSSHRFGNRASMVEPNAYIEYAQDGLPLDAYPLLPPVAYVNDNISKASTGSVNFGKTKSPVTYFKLKVLSADDHQVTFDWVHQTNGSRDFNDLSAGFPLATVETFKPGDDFGSGDDAVLRPGTNEVWLGGSTIIGGAFHGPSPTTIIDGYTGRIIDEFLGLGGIHFNRSGNRGYTIHEEYGYYGHTITEIDPSTKSVLRNIRIPGTTPDTSVTVYDILGLDPAEQHLFVLIDYSTWNGSSSTHELAIVYIDLQTEEVKEFLVGGVEYFDGAWFIPELNELLINYLPEGGNDEMIDVYDATTLEKKITFDYIGWPTDVALSKDGTELYIADCDGPENPYGLSSGGLVVVNPETKEFIDLINLGGDGFFGYNICPYGLALSPDGRFAYTKEHISLLQFDLEKRIVSNQINLGMTRVDYGATSNWLNSHLVAMPDGQTIVASSDGRYRQYQIVRVYGDRPDNWQGLPPPTTHPYSIMRGINETGATWSSHQAEQLLSSSAILREARPYGRNTASPWREPCRVMMPSCAWPSKPITVSSSKQSEMPSARPSVGRLTP